MTRILINLLRKRKDVLSLTVELIIPDHIPTPEDTSYYDEDIDELLAATAAADNIDTLNRIYNASQG